MFELQSQTKFLSLDFYPSGKKHNMWRKILLLGLLSLAILNPPAFLLAQNPPVKFERISVVEGLSQSSGNCILQDRQGFLWFGTQDGLNKYDGYNFTVYRHDPLDLSLIIR